jgi:hypothetical protein
MARGQCGHAVALVGIECRGCGRWFFRCRRCYHGQRYCGKRCRKAARRDQTSAARKRHIDKNPEAARQDHADRQRRYRQRQQDVDAVLGADAPLPDQKVKQSLTVVDAVLGADAPSPDQKVEQSPAMVDAVLGADAPSPDQKVEQSLTVVDAVLGADAPSPDQKVEQSLADKESVTDQSTATDHEPLSPSTDNAKMSRGVDGPGKPTPRRWRRCQRCHRWGRVVLWVRRFEPTPSLRRCC